MKLFRKDIEPRCAYCEKGSQFSETEVACVKRGIVLQSTTAAPSATTPSSGCRPGR